MGFEKLRRPFIASEGNIDMRGLRGAAAIPANKLVRLSAAGVVAQTTGSSGVRAFGVTQAAATTATNSAVVRIWGVTTVRCSSRAVAVGDWLRATSGAASTKAGGTVRSSTTLAQNVIGIALTSAAAAAAGGSISMLITQSGLSRIV